MKFCSGCKRCYDDGVATCADGCSNELSRARQGGLDQIDGYRLERLIDSGVRGENYTATRLDCGRTCRIRIVQAHGANGEKFLQEAATVQAIFHHGIVDIYEAGRLVDDEFFVVSEHLEATSLRDRLNDGPLDLLTAIRIARQTAEAVHALHTSGIAHRAINPANIFLATDHKGEMLVRLTGIDLGGAAEHAIVSNKFLIDTALDSLRYFSPEQCRGEASTAKSDIYALGVVVYEMLAGEPPFDAANASGLIEQHLSMNAPEIKINNFDLRALISHALMEALQKQPSLRQASADLFARQMRHVEQLATHAATPPPAVAVREQPKTPQPATAIVVSPVDLDPPSLAEAEAAGASFANLPESTPATALRTAPGERNVIAIGDANSETLGPRAEQNDAEFEIFKSAPAEPNILAKAASFASGLLKTAPTSADEPAFPKTIDFSAVRRQIPALLAKAEKLNSAPRPEPKLIKWDQPLDDIPSMDGRGFESVNSSSEVPSAPTTDASATLPKRRESVTPITKAIPLIGAPKDLTAGSAATRVSSERPPLSVPTVVTSESATLAAAPVAKAGPVRSSIIPERSSDSSDLVPSFLGARPTSEPAPTDLFATFEGLSAIRFPRARRVAAVGAVFGVLALAFMLRGEIVDALTPYDLASEYPVVPVRTVTEQLPATSAPAVTVSAVPDTFMNQPEIVNGPASRPEALDEEIGKANEAAETIKPVRIATAAPPVAKKAESYAEPAPSRPQKTVSPVKTEAIVPSTRVITYSKSNAADRDPFAAPRSASGLTRPRIVKNPKP